MGNGLYSMILKYLVWISMTVNNIGMEVNKDLIIAQTHTSSYIKKYQNNNNNKKNPPK